MPEQGGGGGCQTANCDPYNEVALELGPDYRGARFARLTIDQMFTLAEILPMIKSTSQTYGEPQELILAVIWHESKLNPGAFYVNSNGTIDRGLMGINSATAKKYGVHDLNDLYDAAFNIDLGTQILRDTRANVYGRGGDYADVIAAYNEGTGNWGNFGIMGPDPKKWDVAGYVGDVLSNMRCGGICY